LRREVEIAQIDESDVMDIAILNEDTGKSDRPTIKAIIDPHSCMIAGFQINLGTPEVKLAME